MKYTPKNYLEGHSVDELGVDTDSILLSFSDVPFNQGLVGSVLDYFAVHNVNVDILTQTAPIQDKTEVAYIIDKKDLAEAMKAIDWIHKKYYGISSEINTNIARISISGIGMRTQPGVAAKFLSVLSDLDVEILMITTSEIRIAAVINKQDLKRSVLALQEAFQL